MRLPCPSLLAIALLAAGCAPADEGQANSPIAPPASEGSSAAKLAADAYARAYDLSPLRSGSKNELRLWFLEPMEGGISTAVFAENGARSCEGKSKYGENSEVVPGPGLCRSVISGLSKGDLERKLHSFSELAHENTSCDDVMDGWGVTVDGVVDGKRFVFEAWNPDGCDHAGAKQLHDLIQSLDGSIKR